MFKNIKTASDRLRLYRFINKGIIYWVVALLAQFKIMQNSFIFDKNIIKDVCKEAISKLIKLGQGFFYSKQDRNHKNLLSNF